MFRYRKTKAQQEWISTDVYWHIPANNKKGRKTIAYSTKATKDLLSILSKEYNTINELYNKVNFDQEAKKVLQKYIDLGRGEESCKGF